jgi:hypothetical protein
MAISKAIPSGRGGCIRIRRELCGCVSIDSRLRFCKVVVSCLLYLLLSMSIPSSSSSSCSNTDCGILDCARSTDWYYYLPFPAPLASGVVADIVSTPRR